MPTVAPVKWTTTLIWSLLEELAKRESHAALYGERKGENTHGASKSAIHKRIASKLFPDNFKGNEAAYAGKVKSKIEWLHKTYKGHLKRLTGTGGGLGGNDDAPTSQEDTEGGSDTEERQEEPREGIRFIGPDGPDQNTPVEAKNLWDDILQKFEYFSEMHSYLCGRPNTVPPAITTGVGPLGAATVVLQPLSSAPSPLSQSSNDTSQDTPPATQTESDTPASPKSSGRKSAPRSSSFTLSQTLVEETKIKIQKTPAKRSFEDRLADAAEKNLEAASKRAEATLRIEEKKIILAQLEQLGKKRDAIISAVTALLNTPNRSRAKLEQLEKEEDLLQCKLDALDDTDCPSKRRNISLNDNDC